MAGIDKTPAVNNFQHVTEAKKDTVEQKKEQPHFILKFKQIEKLEKQIKELKDKIKILRPMNEAQENEKTQLETLLKIYESQLEELKKENETPPFFGLG